MNAPVTCRPSELIETDALALARLLQVVWPQAVEDVEQYAIGLRQESPDRPDNRNHIIWEAGKPIAAAQTFARTIHFAGQSLTVLALARVCAEPTQQGRGLGAQIVRRAFEPVDSGRYALSLYQTGVPGFYEKLGAKRVDNEFFNAKADNPDESPWWNDYIMIYPGIADWPAGRIDLNGPGY